MNVRTNEEKKNYEKKMIRKEEKKHLNQCSLFETYKKKVDRKILFIST